MSFEKIIDAWRLAALDLGIKIESPFILTTENKKSFHFDLLIKDFGRKLGTIVSLIEDMDAVKYDVAKENGFYVSALNVDSYSIYERQLFIDTLNDWGYFGQELNKPNWYTGQPWS